MAKKPIKPIYLFYGDQADRILEARDEIVRALLPEEEARGENLTEYYPTAKANTFSLASALDEIAGDLATVSFLPEAPKCVVVMNPAELLGKSGGRRKAADKESRQEQRLVHWITHNLPATGQHMVLLAFEDEADMREVRMSAPLFKAIMQVGTCTAFKDKPAFFKIEDALVARRPSALIAAVRDLWKPSKGDASVYSSVVRTLRYLIQANIARERRLRDDPALLADLFPGAAQQNLFKASPHTQRRYLARPVYRTRDLLDAYCGVLQVYRALRPRPDDIYVPDALGLLEETLMRLMTSPRPGR